MCFIVDVDNKKVQIADTDIVCWKHGFLNGKEFYSKYRNFQYRKGELNMSPFFNGKKYKTDDSLNLGFHSYSKRFPAFGSLCLKRFIIPKGSRYLVNPVDNEYISNQIIMV